jgi:hypothetical protein
LILKVAIFLGIQGILPQAEFRAEFYGLVGLIELQYDSSPDCKAEPEADHVVQGFRIVDELIS